MLAYLLAWIIGVGSLGIYLAAFFFPEVHRKNDFIWSGIGFFYALVLWVYAERLRGGLLLGQTASVALLVWFGWQTLKLRRELTPSKQQTAIPDTTAVQAKVGGITSNLQRRLANLPIRRTASRQTGVATGSPNPARPPSTAPSSSSPAPSISQPETVTQLPTSSAETAAPAPSSTPGETVASEPEVLSSTGVTSGSPPAANTTDAPETAKGSSQTKLAGLQATATNLVANLRNQIQGILRGRNFNLGTSSAKQGSALRKSKPGSQAVKTGAPAATRTVMPPESAPTITGVQPEGATSAAAAGNRDTETAPASKLGFGEGVQTTPIEEIAPEVELAPPAEPPSQANIEMVAGPASINEGTEESPEEVASLPANEEHPELVRPNPPDSSLTEAAQRAAEAKPESAEGPSSSTSASDASE